MNQTKIIINADDFGYDESHTTGIIKAFELGLISNTTVMVNMPFFDESCRLAEKYGIKDKVGLHLNLVEGTPLTKEIQSCSTFCDKDGKLHGLWRTSVLKTSILNKYEKSLLKQEIIAQFTLFEQKGFSLKHFDSHGHSHTYFSVWKLLLSILKDKKYDYTVRLAKNLFDAKASSLKTIYKKAINKKIPNKMRCSNYFTDIKGYLKNASLLHDDSIIEIMCHPCWVNDGLYNPNDLQLSELHSQIICSNISSF